MEQEGDKSLELQKNVDITWKTNEMLRKNGIILGFTTGRNLGCHYVTYLSVFA